MLRRCCSAMAGTGRANASRKVVRNVESREQREGEGARVRRSIGAVVPQLDPFLMLDNFCVQLPAGFPSHPHRGFETVTYVLPESEGGVWHEDFKGHQGQINPGGVQWMSAARGIIHAEMPSSREKATNGLQLWVNLPKHLKLAEPDYQEFSPESLPRGEKDGVSAIVIAGQALGAESPTRTRTPSHFQHFKMAPGAVLRHPVPEKWTAFAYTLAGEGFFGADQSRAKASRIVVFSANEGEAEVTVHASDVEGCEFVLVAGQPLNEPVAQQGPFVMSSTEELRQAMMDFQTASNGFEGGRSWRAEIDSLAA